MHSLSARLLGRSALVAALVATYAPACGGQDDSATGPSSVLLQGLATDEGLTTFVAAPSRDDATRGPALTSPASGAKVAGTSPAMFAWAAPTALVAPAQQRRERFVTPIPFGPMREAHAHGAVMSGRAYLLTLTSGTTNVVQVFTTNTSYTPDADAWQRLVNAKSIAATIATAFFDNGNLIQGSGPFVGAATTFTVEP